MGLGTLCIAVVSKHRLLAKVCILFMFTFKQHSHYFRILVAHSNHLIHWFVIAKLKIIVQSVFIFFKLSVSHSSFFFLSVFFQACQLLLQQQQQPQQQLLQNQRKFTPNMRQQADPQQVHVNTTHHSLLGHLFTSSVQTMTLVFLSCLLSWPGSWLCYSSRGSSRLEV